MKVVIYSPSILPDRHFGTDLEIAKTHLDKGDEVHFIVCDTSMKYCEQNPVHELNTCILCVAKRKYGLNLIGIPNENIHELKLHNYFPDFDIPDFYNPEDLFNYKYKNLNSGLTTLSTLITIVRDSKPNLPTFQDMIKKMIKTNIAIYESIYELLKEISPDLFYFFNGRTNSRYPAITASKELGIKFFIQESAGILENYDLFENNGPHSLDYMIEKASNYWKDFDSSEENKKQAEKWFETRRGGKAQTWYSFTDTQKLNKLPQNFDKAKVNIAIFISSDDEFECTPEWRMDIFRDQNITIQKLINLIDDDGYHFYLRVHPNLKSLDNYQTRGIKNLFAHNLTIIDADADIDSYYLLDSCDKVVHFGSTMGIEAVYYNKPSIILANTLYEGCYKPTSFEEAVKLIKDRELKPLSNKAALQFAYWQETSGIPYKYYEPTGILTGTFEGKSLNDYDLTSKNTLGIANDFYYTEFKTKESNKIKNKPLVSVIICMDENTASNESENRIIKLIEAQDYENFEIIIVSNNKIDNINNIKVIPNNNNNLFENLINAGNISRGEYILFITEDIYIFNFAISEFISKVITDKSKVIKSDYFDVISDSKKYIYKEISKNTDLSLIINQLLTDDIFISNFLFEKNFFLEKILNSISKLKHINDNKIIRLNIFKNIIENIENQSSKVEFPTSAYIKKTDNILENDVIYLNPEKYSDTIWELVKNTNSRDIISSIKFIFNKSEENKNISEETRVFITKIYQKRSLEIISTSSDKDELKLNYHILSELKDRLNELIRLNNRLMSREQGEFFNTPLDSLNLNDAFNLFFRETEKKFTGKLFLTSPLSKSYKNNLANSNNSVGEINITPYQREFYKELDFFIYFNDKEKELDKKYLIIYNSWYLGNIPSDWVEYFNLKIDQVWVPFEFNKNLLINSGVESSKIHVVHEPINIDVFKHKNKVSHDKFRFIYSGDITEFNGVEVLIKAFTKVFHDNSNVELLINSTNIFDYEFYNQISEKILELNSKNKAKISLIKENLNDEQLVDLYNSSDCYVYPYKACSDYTNVLQAISCKLPIIITDNNEIDFYNSESAYTIKSEYSDFEDIKIEGFYQDIGISLFTPDEISLCQQMKIVYEDKKNNPEIINKKTENAYKFLIDNFSIENIKTNIKNNLEDLNNKPIFRFELDRIINNLEQEAFNAFNNKEFSLSADLFSKLLIYSNNSKNYYYLGLSQFYQQNFEDAIASLAECLELGMVNYDICNFMAKSLHELGDDETAEVYFQKANELK